MKNHAVRLWRRIPLTARIVGVFVAVLVMGSAYLRYRHSIERRYNMQKALLASALNNDSALLQSILPYKPDLNFVPGSAETPLAISMRLDNTAVASLLIAHKANPNVIDSEGWTPLMNAASRGQNDLVKELLEAGANPNTVSKEDGTALSIAQRWGDDETVQILQDAVNKTTIAASKADSNR